MSQEVLSERSSQSCFLVKPKCVKSKAKKSKATCVQSEGSQVKFEESQPTGKSPPLKFSSFKPPKRNSNPLCQALMRKA